MGKSFGSKSSDAKTLSLYQESLQFKAKPKGEGAFTALARCVCAQLQLCWCSIVLHRLPQTPLRSSYVELKDSPSASSLK